MAEGALNYLPLLFCKTVHIVFILLFCPCPPVCNITLPILNWGNKDESSFNSNETPMAATKGQILKLTFEKV